MLDRTPRKIPNCINCIVQRRKGLLRNLMQFALGCHVMNTERIWGMSIGCLQGKVLQEAPWAVKRLWLFCQGAISRCQFHQGCGISLFCLPAKRSCQAVPAMMSDRFLIQSKTRHEIHASWLLVTSPTPKQNRAIQRPRNWISTETLTLSGVGVQSTVAHKKK